jgi:hypothetical protein
MLNIHRMNYAIILCKGGYYLVYKAGNVGHMTQGIVIGLPEPMGDISIGETLQYHWSWVKKGSNDMQELVKEYDDNWKSKKPE